MIQEKVDKKIALLICHEKMKLVKSLTEVSREKSVTECDSGIVLLSW